MEIVQYSTIMNKENVMTLVRERLFFGAERKKKNKFENPQYVAEFFDEAFQLSDRTEEYVYLMGLNTKHSCTGVFELSHGNISTSICSPRETFAKLLLCNSAGFILIHNHPSGDVSPSTQDLETAKTMKAAGELMGINLLDFIIVGKEDSDLKYYSFTEEKAF